jgi:signal transduction histidine kinase
VGRPWSNGVLNLAVGAAVAYTILFPLLRITEILALPAYYAARQDRIALALVATAFYLPVQIWLVVAATHGPFGRWQQASLTAMTVVTLGLIPVVGPYWIGMLYVPGTLALAGLRPPWSVLVYGALTAVPAPASLALGDPGFAAFYTAGMLIVALPMAVGLRLIRTVRRLQSARLALAEQAVQRERIRIDSEVRESVGAGLVEILAHARRAAARADSSPAAAARELRVLVDGSRRTLGETRRLVSGFRRPSLRAELQTAATLLAVAGIDTRLELPADLPEGVSDRDRARLRADVARLLGATDLAISTAIVVTCREGQPRIEVRTGPDQRPAQVTMV